MPRIITLVGPLEEWAKKIDPDRTNLIAIALVLRYGKACALDTLLERCGSGEYDQEDEIIYAVPNRHVKYMKRKFNGTEDHYWYTVNINKTQYLIDQIEETLRIEPLTEEKYNLIKDYDDWWEFDDSDWEDVAEAKLLIPTLPTPRQLHALARGYHATRYDDMWNEFCAACYAIEDFDHTAEMDILQGILESRDAPRNAQHIRRYRPFG